MKWDQGRTTHDLDLETRSTTLTLYLIVFAIAGVNQFIFHYKQNIVFSLTDSAHWLKVINTDKCTEMAIASAGCFNKTLFFKAAVISFDMQEA